MSYKKRNIKKWMLLSLVLMVTCFIGCDGEYIFELSQDVKLYCQKTSAWCGAASIQMIINSYPVPGECVFRTQQMIMDTICDCQGTTPPCKDPTAVKDAIMKLDHPTSTANWVVYSNTVKEDLMYDIMYWMARQEYPTATIRSGVHWVVVTGYVASADPLTNSSVDLEFLVIHDGLPSCMSGGGDIDVELEEEDIVLEDQIEDLVGHIKGISSTTWYNNTQYWGSTVSLAGWTGKYVAVIEPPKTKGRATAPEEYIGTEKEIISPERAAGSAAQWIKKLKIYKRKGFRFFKELVPQSPVLVRYPECQKHYYLVPFGLEKGGPARGWFILNAYNGRFQEFGGYKTKFSCLSREEAIKIALREAKVEKYERIDAELIFQHSAEANAFCLPLWQITIDSLLLYVGQGGKVYWELTPPPC